MVPEEYSQIYPTQETIFSDHSNQIPCIMAWRWWKSRHDGSNPIFPLLTEPSLFSYSRPGKSSSLYLQAQKRQRASPKNGSIPVLPPPEETQFPLPPSPDPLPLSLPSPTVLPSPDSPTHPPTQSLESPSHTHTPGQAAQMGLQERGA